MDEEIDESVFDHKNVHVQNGQFYFKVGRSCTLGDALEEYERDQKENSKKNDYDCRCLGISNEKSNFSTLKSYFKNFVVAISVLAGTFYLSAGLEGFGWNPYEYKDVVKRLDEEAEHKSFVIDYLENSYGMNYVEDYRNGEMRGLSTKAQHSLDTLLGTLRPTPEDWENTYNKIIKK